MSADYKDAVIDVFARDEQALLELVADVTADRDSFRALAQQAIHQLHAAQRQQHQLEDQQARLVDENRRLRAATILTKAFAA